MIPRTLRWLPSLLVLAALATRPLASQQLTRADSNLVYAILTAEDRRDSMAPALVEGMRHADARIRVLAERAKGRITDSTYAARGTLPAPAPRVTWPLPAWRLRYDSLRIRRDDCSALSAALRDTVIQVRLRALDLLPAACAGAPGLQSLLLGWLDEFPDPPRDLPPPHRWHQVAHASVATARLWPDSARPRVARLARTRRWEIRMYAARAAQFTSDTALLRRLTRDGHGNVVEAAVTSLVALGGHAHDATYLQVLRSVSPPAARIAAVALKGSPRTDVPLAAGAVYGRWRARRIDSERDTRLALLDLMGRPASEDVRRPIAPLPRSVVAIALGRMDTLEVGIDGAKTPVLVRLRGDIAPITAARILDAVAHGKYRDGSWHRVVPDFVIQGGLPGDNEYVGGDRFYRDELGGTTHLRGSVGMSTRGHDTGDGQWFIDLSDLPRLDRDYTLFGEVVAGMDVMDATLEGTSIEYITRYPLRRRR